MKKALLNTLQIILKTALAAVLFIMTWNWLTPYFRVNRNTDGDLFRNLPEDTIDVIALGSSHIQYAFNPAVFYAETGNYSYVLGSSCQPFSMSYYMLEEALKTQHPSVVVLDVFTLLPQSQVCYADGLYYKAIDMMSGDTRYEAGKYGTESLPENLQEAYTYDLILNHDHWKDMDFSDPDSIKANTETAEGYHWDLGYVRQEPEKFQYTPLQVLEVEDDTVALSEDETKWIDKINDLCTANDIHLILVKTPYIENQADADKLNAIWKYAEDKKIEHIDYIQKAESLDWFMDMDGDTWHNNSWGAEIITRDLADTVTKEGYITDHKDNSDVNYLLDGAMHSTAYSLLNSHNINIYTLMTFAGKYPCVTLLRFKGSMLEDGTPNSGSIQNYENNALQEIGFGHDFQADADKDYYGIAVDGELLQSSNEPFEAEVNGHTVTFTEDDILIDGASAGSNSKLQIVFNADDFSWKNAVGIDYDEHWFWKSGCDSWNCMVEP